MRVHVRCASRARVVHSTCGLQPMELCFLCSLLGDGTSIPGRRLSMDIKYGRNWPSVKQSGSQASPSAVAIRLDGLPPIPSKKHASCVSYSSRKPPVDYFTLPWNRTTLLNDFFHCFPMTCTLHRRYIPRALVARHYCCQNPLCK